MKKSEMVTKLDNVFSKFIRYREAVNYGRGGLVRCFTCGKIGGISEMQCGHYHSRRKMGTRWNEQNCQVQCKACNLFQEGNKPKFTINLINIYGIEILQKLDIKANSVNIYKIYDLERMFNYYTAELKKLQEILGVKQ